MTEQETIVMNKLAEAWNEFNKLPPVHQDEGSDFRFHFHALQKIIFSRPMIKWESTPLANWRNNLPEFKSPPPPPPPRREFANINTSQDV